MEVDLQDLHLKDASGGVDIHYVPNPVVHKGLADGGLVCNVFNPLAVAAAFRAADDAEDPLLVKGGIKEPDGGTHVYHVGEIGRASCRERVYLTV